MFCYFGKGFEAEKLVEPVGLNYPARERQFKGGLAN
jgi:hypothetical protein